MQELRFAVKNTIPIFFTYLFIGIAFGILTVDAGYSVLLSVASAFFIFAGSMQLVMIPMMTSGASLATLALMTFFINARHIFYGISFVERFRKMGWRGVYMVLTLTDETYSVLCTVQYEPGLDENRATFYIALLNHFYWIFGCLVGACAGRLLPFDMTGIDFSATAFFWWSSSTSGGSIAPGCPSSPPRPAHWASICCWGRSISSSPRWLPA